MILIGSLARLMSYGAGESHYLCVAMPYHFTDKTLAKYTRLWPAYDSTQP